VCAQCLNHSPTGETYFAAKIQGRERSKGASHAPLLSVVPDRIIWDAFLVSVCGAWRDLEKPAVRPPLVPEWAVRKVFRRQLSRIVYAVGPGSER
jgi:hypothetical protein